MKCRSPIQRVKNRQRLKNKPRANSNSILLWLKNHSRSVFPFILLIALIILSMILIPRESTIFYEGVAEQADFLIRSDQQVAYDIIIDDSQNGEIMFGANETETICAVEKSAPKELIQQVLDNDLDAIDWEVRDDVFPFIDGTATLFTGSPLHLMLEAPEGESFTYDMEIVQDRNKINKDGERNRIELKNFPEDLVIYLSASQNIRMKGSAQVEMPAGKYRIIGCRSITFYEIPKTNTSPDPRADSVPQLNETVEHFRFTNSEKDVFEITYFAETKFSEVGHIEVEGDNQEGQELTLEVNDIGQYPIPVKIYGRAGKLTMAGFTSYPSWSQWILDKRSELLFSIVMLYIGGLFEKAKGKNINS